MKVQNTEINQDCQACEVSGYLGTKNQKICLKKSGKGKKQIKKDRKILKNKKNQSNVSNKDKTQLINPKISEQRNRDNIEEKKKKEKDQFFALNLKSFISSLGDKVSEFFFTNTMVSLVGKVNQQKSGQQIEQKMTTPAKQNKATNFLKSIIDQSSIKIVDLLQNNQNNQRLLFQSSFIEDTQSFQNQAEFFLSQSRLYKDNENHKCKQQQLLSQIIVILNLISQTKSTLVSIQNNASKCLSKLKDEIRIISFCQSQFIKEMANFQYLWQTQISNSIKQTSDLKEITKILIVLLKCYKANNLKTKKIINQVLKREQIVLSHQSVLTERYSPLTNQQFYTKCLIKKCLIKTFSEDQTLIKNKVELWNFFKLNAHNQQSITNQGFHDHKSYESIETQHQYKEYIKRATNIKILCKQVLHTSCKACFSSHFQKYNPIIKCSQCKYRIHVNCGKADDKCDRCQYKKLGTLLKANVERCFICHNQTSSLMLHKIKAKMFAHNFCLMVHNLWTLEGNKFSFDHNKYSLLKTYNKEKIQSSQYQQCSKIIDQTQEKVIKSRSKKQNTNLTQKYCKFCGKSQQIQNNFLRKCSNCDDSVHILCAYLNGCRIQITQWIKNFQIQLKITCCPKQAIVKKIFEQHRQKLLMSRKYKLNYENFAINFDKQRDIQSSIFKQNPKICERKLTTANIQLEVNNVGKYDYFDLDQREEAFQVNQ